MKKHSFLLVISVVFISCTSLPHTSNPMQLPWTDSVTIEEDPGIVIYPPSIGSPIGTATIAFIKFKKEEYKKYIIAEPAMEDGYYSFRWMMGINVEKLLGSSPYIDLPNGYVAIDWKWGHGSFCYEPLTLLLNKPWESFKHYDQRWTYDDVLQPEVHEIIKEAWIVGYQHLDWYFGNYRIPVNPKTNLPANVCSYIRFGTLLLSLNDISGDYRDYMEQAIYEEDKRFTVYLEMVKKLIESGEYTKECQLWEN